MDGLSCVSLCGSCAALIGSKLRWTQIQVSPVLTAHHRFVDLMEEKATG